MKFIKKNLIFILLIPVLLLGFSLGFLTGKIEKPVLIEGVCNLEEGKPEGIDFSLFWDAWRILQEKYLEALGPKEMLYGAISGMVKSLKDPYTVFLNPEESKTFKEDIAGKFEGVGMEIGMRKNELTVISPLEGTPAEKAGIRAGDKILKIDDRPTQDLTIEEAVHLIRGQRGTTVSLTIFREEWEVPKEVKIVRAVIEIPILKWEIKRPENGYPDLAYLKLYHFSETASSEFKKAALQILASPCKKMILDLRNNPGGYLEVAQDIAGWFLERGKVVAIEDFGEQKERKEYKARGNAKFLDWPMVVLLNQGSASGSEILAGALRDNRGILIIGEKSFGKGSVQELAELKEGSSLKVTIAKWLTPKGQLIAEKGLEPDIKVEMTDEDYTEGRDPQLDKAIEVLKDL